MFKAIFTFFIFTVIIGCGCKSNNDVFSQQNSFIENKNEGVLSKSKSNDSDKDCSFDFKNFTYPSLLKDKRKLKLINGILEPSKNSEGLIDDSGYLLSSEYYGDLFGNQQNEAVVTLSVTTGGSAQINTVYIYDLSQKKPKLVWTYISGDRADGGLRNVFVSEKNLIIETYEPSLENGDCCPKTFKRTTYKWRKNKFMEDNNINNIPNERSDASFIGESTPCAVYE